jgi:formate-dependent nitrite reductase membrane component NrfD
MRNSIVGGSDLTVIALDTVLFMSVLISFAAVLSEVYLMPAHEDAKRATLLMTSGELRGAFWLGAIGMGMLTPAILIVAESGAGVSSSLNAAASIFALAGLYAFESAWVRAGQAVPLS